MSRPINEKEPHDAKGWRLAWIEHQKNWNFDEALEAYKKAIELSPTGQL
jgi:cytochrome c-type biogenesis protein CcmH/NrfG